jgi:hypothetical protein
MLWAMALNRYRLSYGGIFIGSFDTAKEALEGPESHEIVRRVTDKERKFRYSVRDGGKEITIADLRRLARAEESAM